jgi:L-fuconolactonase
MGRLLRDFGPDEFGAIIRRWDIGKSILVQAEPTEMETDYCLAVARETPFVAGVIGWVDLARSDAPAVIARRAQDRLFRGLRAWIIAQPDPDWLRRDEVRRGLAVLAEQRLCCEALLGPAQLPEFLSLLDALPGLRVVLCHAAKPEVVRWTPDGQEFRDWSRHLKCCAEKGCYVKLSGLMTESGDDWVAADLKPYFEAILESFGPSRTIWGSDWPVINRAGGYEKWLQATRSLATSLRDPDRDDLFGGSAARFYGV